MALLDVDQLSKRFGGLQAVSDVSFEIETRQIFSMIGPNGAGKTTVFNMLTGLTAPSKGQITFDGRSIVGLRPDQVADRGMARTFQNVRLFSHMTARENVMVGRHARMQAHVWDSLLSTRFARREEHAVAHEAEELLAFVGLSRYADEPARNLPYGRQRRLEIARALATKPKLILLDEPGAGMNSTEKVELRELVRRIRDGGVTVFLIEHDVGFVMSLSERIVVLDFGTKIADGLPHDVRSDRRVIQAYLGKGA